MNQNDTPDNKIVKTSKVTRGKPATAKPTVRPPRPPVERPRKASAGDISPARTVSGIESHAVAEAGTAALAAKKSAVHDILAHAAAGDNVSMAKALEEVTSSGKA